MTSPSRPASRSINQTVALVFGAVYALVGIVGFFVSDTFAEQSDNSLLGFSVNYLHDIVHLLIGLALIGASRAHPSARAANLAIGATYVLLGIVGPFVDDTAVDVIALNSPDHVLHLVSGIVLAGTALAADKNRTAVRRS